MGTEIDEPKSVKLLLIIAATLNMGHNGFDGLQTRLLSLGRRRGDGVGMARDYMSP